MGRGQGGISRPAQEECRVERRKFNFRFQFLFVYRFFPGKSSYQSSQLGRFARRVRTIKRLTGGSGIRVIPCQFGPGSTDSSAFGSFRLLLSDIVSAPAGS